MYKVVKEIHFCYGHRLLNYQGGCEHLHGHSSKVEIELATDKLDKAGMVSDFSEIKNVVKKWVENDLDHKMFLDEKDPLVQVLKKEGEPVVLFKGNPTAERIAEKIFNYVKSQKFPVSEIRIWETQTSYAAYNER